MVTRAAKLNKDEKKQLAKALADAKRATSARIKLSVVYVSDKYPLYPLIYGGLAGVIAMGVLAIGWPGLPIRDGFYIAVAALVVVTALTDIMPLRLKLIPKAAKFWECWELAHRSFASRILARNDRRTGILLFVSIGEHYIEVVTDRDVDRHILQTEWDKLIRAFGQKARQKQYGEGLITLVRESAKLLAAHYPPEA